MSGVLRTRSKLWLGVATLGAAAVIAAAAPQVGGGDGVAVAQATKTKKKVKKVAPRPVASRPTTAEAWTARVMVPVHPRTAPRAGAKRMSKLTGLAPYNGNPESLLVVGATTSVKNGVWYKVLLPSRPNDATGWVPAAAVRVTKTPYRVVVDISDRELTLLRRGKAVGTWKVAVGTNANPTPVGSFAVSEIVPQRTTTGFYGSHIVTLTSHSENLNEFDGGDGRVALHGTNRPDLLGGAVSHGCVRLTNEAITRIARVVPAGAPVDIVE